MYVHVRIIRVPLMLQIQEESDSVPYYPHNGNGMRPVEAPPHVPDHLIPRSLSEEARLVQMGGLSGGAYTPLEEGRQYPQNYPGQPSLPLCAIRCESYAAAVGCLEKTCGGTYI